MRIRTIKSKDITMVTKDMQLETVKICNCCGLTHTVVPKERCLGITDIGFWFDCPCGSTLLGKEKR